MNISSTTRRPDLDWLRVLAIASVFFFHNARFYDFDGWHVKNATGSALIQVLVSFMTTWMMPVIFLISAASLVYALSRGLHVNRHRASFPAGGCRRGDQRRGGGGQIHDGRFGSEIAGHTLHT